MGLGPFFFAGSALIAIFALYLSFTVPSAPLQSPVVIGKNNTALFLTNSEFGLSNVHLATTQALLEQHPHVQIHFASFTPLGPKLQRISSYGRKVTATAKDIVFHELDGLSLGPRAKVAGQTMSGTLHPPGLAGIDTMCKQLQLYLSPWNAEEHLAMYEQVKQVITELNPAIVVLDSLLRPAIDAVRDQNRLHAFVTPNTLVDNFSGDQPWKMLWKYPCMGSGIPYPVPWNRMAENIYLNFRFISSVFSIPEIKRKQTFLKSKGVRDPLNLMLHRPDVPWLTETMPGASIPVDPIPPNVTCTGPMVLSLGPAEEQDPVLTKWLSRAPTVLVNLGSVYTYSEPVAKTMAKGLAGVLATTDVQILWKFRGRTSDVDDGGVLGDDFKLPLQPFIDSERIRMMSWLPIDPPSILESGYVIASVHHGGSGCYHEAISAGVAQIILPQWLDLYSFAQLAEDIGVGLWGCRETSPFWTADCLQDAILRVIDRSNGSVSMQNKAKELGKIAQSDPGRYVAAREIAKLAGSGK